MEPRSVHASQRGYSLPLIFDNSPCLATTSFSAVAMPVARSIISVGSAVRNRPTGDCGMVATVVSGPATVRAIVSFCVVIVSFCVVIVSVSVRLLFSSAFDKENL